MGFSLSREFSCDLLFLLPRAECEMPSEIDPLRVYRRIYKAVDRSFLEDQEIAKKQHNFNQSSRGGLISGHDMCNFKSMDTRMCLDFATKQICPPKT